ncbi:hypothetical protein HanIR_Chr04g0168541 [Helianthus annuus]|nr:hypothetical protein HanIR_Chr04g0168541 [Helianthus annuus]
MSQELSYHTHSFGFGSSSIPGSNSCLPPPGPDYRVTPVDHKE